MLCRPIIITCLLKRTIVTIQLTEGGKYLAQRPHVWGQPCSLTPLTYVSPNVKETVILKSNVTGLHGTRKLQEL